MNQAVSISLLSSPIILKFISLLTKSACPSVCFLEYQVCRTLIDVTWKKSFELNRFLYCWASFSDSLVCYVTLKKGKWCVAFPMPVSPGLSFLFFFSLPPSFPPSLFPSLPSPFLPFKINGLESKEIETTFLPAFLIFLFIKPVV